MTDREKCKVLTEAFNKISKIILETQAKLDKDEKEEDNLQRNMEILLEYNLKRIKEEQE